MSSLSQPLLVRSSLLPDECLFSLLLRLTQLNSYDSPKVLAQLALTEEERPNFFNDDLEFPLRSETYRRLANLTQLNFLTLYTATSHRFARVLTPPPSTAESFELPNGVIVPYFSRFPSLLIPKQMRSASSGQFCPICLKEAPYYRLHWIPVAASVCLNHKCLLLDLCQECHNEVSIQSIIVAKCNKCGADLTRAQAPSIKEDTFGILAQNTIQSWFLHYDKTEPIISLPPEQPPMVLYRVVDGLQSSVHQRYGLNWPHLHRINAEQYHSSPPNGRKIQTLTPYESYCLYTTAFRGIVNWPQGFYELLSAYQYNGPGGDYKSLSTTLDMLYTKWIYKHWSYPNFDFLQKAFKHWWKTVGSTRYISYLDISDAAQLLKTSHTTINFLIKNGYLATHSAESNSTNGLLSSKDISRLRQNWDELLNLKDTAIFLGVSEEVVVSLVKIGLLSREQSTSLQSFHWTFKRSSIIEYLGKVTKHIECSLLREVLVASPYLNMKEAVKLLSRVGMNIASILSKVADGELSGYLPMNQAFRPDVLFFAQTDILRCRDEKTATDSWTDQEIITLLGISETLLNRWVKLGLIAPTKVYKQILYFDQAAIDKFFANNITCEEAAKIMGVGKLTMHWWIRGGWLSKLCISGPDLDGYHSYLLDKSRLIRWREEHLTFAEAASLLDIPYVTLQQWCKKGKLVPRESIGKKYLWFSKQEVMQIKSSMTNPLGNIPSREDE